MKNHIKQCGIELEGYWENKPEGFKHDGSVEIDEISSECDGSCRDCCECGSYCECEGCQVCNSCDDRENNCECEECLFCNDCDHYIDYCECTPDNEKLGNCTNRGCKNGELCDDCEEYQLALMLENRDIIRNCETYNNCYLECECECNCECNCETSGEIASPILENKQQINDFMIMNYPDIHNSSCGRHDHLSFKDDKRDVYLLARPEFHTYLKNKLYEFGRIYNINSNSRFYKRLEGCYYCKDEFNPESQLSGDGDRYTHINFCSYRKFGTIEFRIGNIFDKKELSVKYTEYLHEIVNEWINSQSVKEYEFEFKMNKNTFIYIKMNMVKSGLRIFVKSHGIEDIVKNDDIMDCDKFKLYSNIDNWTRLNTNLKSLIDKDNCINMTFLRLKNQTVGKSMIIKGIFTDKQITEYYDRLSDELPRLIKDIKGVKMICV